MSTIRVLLLPRNITAKDIKIHFSKPENGGGSVRNVYHPLFHGSAVVEFDDVHTAETVARYTHTIDGEKVILGDISQIQMYTTLEAKLDPSIAAFLLVNDEVRDEVQYHGNLEYHHDNQTNTTSLRGNWYQLEWAWNYMEKIMKRQQRTEQYGGIYRTSEFRLDANPRSDNEAEIPKERPEIDDDNFTEPLHKTPADKNEAKESLKLDSAAKYHNDHARVTDTQRLKVEPKTPKMVKSQVTVKDTNYTETDTGRNSTNRESLVHRKQTAEESEHINQRPNPIVSDNPDDVRSLDFMHGGVMVQVYTGQITFVETEAIVNAAIGNLFNGGGVARAIASAASPQMQTECDAYVRQHGSLHTADVIHTCAGGMISSKVKHILHTVGPIWSVYAQNDEVSHQLTSTFMNCFTYANKALGLKSLALPVISSGIFGVPLETCVASFLEAVLLFARDSGRPHNLREIHLVNNDMENTAITVVILRQLIGHGLENLTSDVVDKFDKMSVKVKEAKARMDTRQHQQVYTTQPKR